MFNVNSSACAGVNINAGFLGVNDTQENKIWLIRKVVPT